MQRFFRWRAETVNLRKMLNNQFFSAQENEVEVTNRLTRTVSDRFIARLLPENDPPYAPWAIFQGYNVNKEEAGFKYERFRSMVKKCMEKAILLHYTMRTGPAQYTFERFSGAFFNRDSQVIEEQRTADGSIRDGKHNIAFTRFPAFVKYGDDYGQKYHEKKILCQSEVILDGNLPSENASSRSKDEDSELVEQLATKLAVSETASEQEKKAENGEGHYFKQMLGFRKMGIKSFRKNGDSQLADNPDKKRMQGNQTFMTQTRTIAEDDRVDCQLSGNNTENRVRGAQTSRQETRSDVRRDDRVVSQLADNHAGGREHGTLAYSQQSRIALAEEDRIHPQEAANNADGHEHGTLASSRHSSATLDENGWVDGRRSANNGHEREHGSATFSSEDDDRFNSDLISKGKSRLHGIPSSFDRTRAALDVHDDRIYDSYK
ncbi:hypothetical protein BT63DRAFT_75418 [Microthyrium microscopicum]|uniref:Uncharacterized protein n=1 Tax=Microthyrium microscopicum TaxID=703497 RepID=A0A6A6U2F5_9PEZI|nr:hypothetical protein BT63DRAFT_75418 [Microthyrium microscopicum]